MQIVGSEFKGRHKISREKLLKILHHLKLIIRWSTPKKHVFASGVD